MRKVTHNPVASRSTALDIRGVGDEDRLPSCDRCVLSYAGYPEQQKRPLPGLTKGLPLLEMTTGMSRQCKFKQQASSLLVTVMVSLSEHKHVHKKYELIQKKDKLTLGWES